MFEESKQEGIAIPVMVPSSEPVERYIVVMRNRVAPEIPYAPVLDGAKEFQDSRLPELGRSIDLWSAFHVLHHQAQL